MSWHAQGLFVKEFSGDFRSLFEKLGLRGGESTAETVSFEDATSVQMTDLAVGSTSGWSILWSNIVLDFLDQEGVRNVSLTSDVYLMALEGSCGFAHLAWWSGGSLVRRRLAIEGEVKVDEGQPLPQELTDLSAPDDEEERMFSLMNQLVLTFEQLDAIRYSVFRFPDIFKHEATTWE